MKLKILSWNVRGANDVAKRKVLKAFIKMQRVDIVCFQETKLTKVSRGMIRSLGWEDFWIGLLLKLRVHLGAFSSSKTPG